MDRWRERCRQVDRCLAALYGLNVYATDDVMRDHAARSTHESAPQLLEFIAMSADDRRLSRSPKKCLTPSTGFAARRSTTFRHAAFSRRGTMWDIPNTTSDPRRAQQNLLERDGMFTSRLSREVKEKKLPFVDVDNSMSEEWQTHTVATMLQL